MAGCSKEQRWFAYYKENMHALGLPVPESWYATQQSVAAEIGLILGTLKSLGATATIRELIGATIGLEKYAVVGSVLAAGYVGAMIGSAAVASGRYAACGTSIADVMFDIHTHGMTLPPWMAQHLRQHPELFGGRGASSAQSYALRTRQ